MDNLQLFMHLYMYELEMWLEYLKYVIENKCNRIVKLCDAENIEFCDFKNRINKYPLNYKVMRAKVEFAYLPEQILPELKFFLKQRKNAVFTNPDLCLAINIDGKIEYETIKLKSTKTDAIPGSNIQQVSPNEFVIFVKHRKAKVEITTGQYFHAINSKMQFPDRSPRPQVSFRELQNWNSSCRHNDDKTITYTSIGDKSFKYELLTDWQGVLAKRWTEIVLDNNPRKHEPQFNNNLRKFILEFLSAYDNMSSDIKEQYKQFLSDIIESKPPVQRVVLIMWSCINKLPEERDYFQVFKLENLNDIQKITQFSEYPEYRREYLIPTGNPITAKVYIIDSDDYSTMLLAEEY